jgi:hypothetical protein
MRFGFPFGLGTISLMLLVLCGCAPKATRGYRVEPAGETVTVPLWLDVVERREGRHVFQVWTPGFSQFDDQVTMNFMVRVDGEGYVPNSASFQLVMDTGTCPKGEGVQVAWVWLPPSNQVRRAGLQRRIDSLRSLREPEVHITEKAFEFLALFAGPSGVSASQRNKQQRKEDSAKWESDRDREVADLEYMLNSLEDGEEALRYEQPYVGGRFQGALRFPWNPRACGMELQYQGQDSVLRFPFRQTRD